jgi:lysylphosphatidylglycerol synthetase-like protein (DUF2156 family)
MGKIFKNYTDKYALIAGVCMAMLVICATVFFSYETFWTVIEWIALVLFSVALFFNNKPITLCAAVARTVPHIYYFISFFDIYNLLNLLSCSTLILIVLFAT